MKAVLESSSGSTRARGAGRARGWFRRRRVSRLWLSTAVAVSLLFGGCFREEKGERFYGKVVVPSAQEFRWSDGGLPKVFDPARAAAPPDTDAVRALYEGLTDYEPGTLRPVPAVASRWESADGGRRWTFHVRESARWTNGDPVTAQDFVRSWQRTLRLGERAPHANLLSNIEGAQALSANYATNAQGGATQDVRPGASEPARALQGQMKNSRTPQPSLASPSFGVVALDARTLRVTLQRPDNNFPALVAHPVFRPVHELTPGGELSELWEEQRQQRQGSAPADFGMVTNGAFSLSRLAGDSVELERADSYWDAASVKLERVRFVEGGGTEAALAAYRAGEVDVVTNAAVEPLAVKLLTPYEDFRRETFAALNYYRFNTARPPFDDLRVRQALAFALDTERLSADTLGGATEATHSFMPVHVDAEANGDGTRDEDEKAETEKAEPADKAARAVESRAPESGESESGAVASGTVERGAVASGAGGGGETGPLVHNVERARRLLEEAGYPGGVNFPRIRLLVNRNEQQRLVAQAVSLMWRDSLGVQTEVDVRPWEE
ncbi:MAG: oligopeptide transport system substrate-binding protein, partial [Acidobacteriota bacterium]|nr:oligopeptide transport system substrate-binding protein [Acidobacteriota bacterium]